MSDAVTLSASLWREDGAGRWTRTLPDGAEQTVRSPYRPLDILEAPISLADTSLHGLKDDAGKDPWDLASWDAFRVIVGVLAFGARKYAPRNWEQGMAWSRLYAAAIRHLAAWWGGERCDAETGLSHLAHAGCCVCFLIAFEIRGIGADDRPRTRFPG